LEKFSPYSKLHKVKALVVAGKVRATYSAVFDAAKMGLSFHDMVDVVLGLTARDFYKSMTTNADHKIWQDVYRPNTSIGEIYLKLTVIDDVLIVSFKEL
jgi:motility quorum-sensing regulator/GCU-specific mRNA interferase toxin